MDERIAGSLPGMAKKMPFRFGFVRSDLWDQARSRDSDRARQLRFRLHFAMQQVCRAEGRAMQAFRAAHINIGLFAGAISTKCGNDFTTSYTRAEYFRYRAGLPSMKVASAGASFAAVRNGMAEWIPNLRAA